jgi:hypothetical protein
MSAVAIEHCYRYPCSSALRERPSGAHLSLATAQEPAGRASPYFFEGRLLAPVRTAALLRGLMEVVRSKFALSPAEIGRLRRMLALVDPVVTSNGERLRFEGFSACGSAYARVDLLPAAVAGDTRGRGTTNVDFNPPLLSALARLQDDDEVDLSIGTKEVRLEHAGAAVVEKKVPLPVRWLKGFSEVHAYQPRLELVFDVAALWAQRFLRELTGFKVHTTSWVVAAGHGLRLSQREAAQAVPVAGVDRLTVLAELARHAQRLRIYADRASQVSAWELVLADARFHLVLSPNPARGFSGEGQLLSGLAAGRWEEELPKVRAALCWQAIIDENELVQRVGAPADVVRAALAALGARGLVGYDLDTGAYFHRELPFDLAQVEALQPRLREARQVLADGGVRIAGRDGETAEVYVRGSEVDHRVRLGADGARCSCLWFAKHAGRRGPCKHVLAAQLALDEALTPACASPQEGA